MKGLANNINRIYLNKWQKEIMIRNYVINFEEFKKIDIIDSMGREVASSSLKDELLNRSDKECFKTAIQGDIYFSEVFISDDLTPSMIISLPIRDAGGIDGIICGEIDLTAMWDLIDSTKIGKNGCAYVLSKSGLLIAHGDNERKPEVFKQKPLHQSAGGIHRSVLKGEFTPLIYKNEIDLQVLSVGHPVQSLDWVVVIEQPANEAFMAATRMTRNLSLLTILFLVIMIIIGTLGGKQVAQPIYEMIKATQIISSGDLTKRVKISTKDEFNRLAESFNSMTERLSRLQEEIRLNERFSISAKVAAGLIHDLKHPIKKIELKFVILAEGARILADKFSFERIIKNLMTNAIEAMPKGGLLLITLGQEKSDCGLNSVKITITDTGVGIAKERIGTIFTDYLSTKKKGVGPWIGYYQKKRWRIKGEYNSRK